MVPTAESWLAEDPARCGVTGALLVGVSIDTIGSIIGCTGKDEAPAGEENLSGVC